MLLKVTRKISLDRNVRYISNHHIHGYCYCSLFLLLFTVYTITVYCYCAVTVTASSQHSSYTNFDCLTELNNNVNGQLILGLGNLMEETTSVFCVDLIYRLRNRLTVPLQSFEGWLTSHLFIVPQCYCEYCSTVILWVLLLLLTTWR